MPPPPDDRVTFRSFGGESSSARTRDRTNAEAVPVAERCTAARRRCDRRTSGLMQANRIAAARRHCLGFRRCAVGRPLQRGLRRSGIRIPATYDYAPASPGMHARARALARACKSYGTTLAHAAIQFPLRHAAVASVLVGTPRPKSTATRRLLRSRLAQLWDEIDRITHAGAVR